jgi:hypothetical protein
MKLFAQKSKSLASLFRKGNLSAFDKFDESLNDRIRDSRLNLIFILSHQSDVLLEKAKVVKQKAFLDREDVPGCFEGESGRPRLSVH